MLKLDNMLGMYFVKMVNLQKIYQLPRIFHEQTHLSRFFSQIFSQKIVKIHHDKITKVNHLSNHAH
jgi:hypothetical protein